MIVGIGIDLIDIRRIEKTYKRFGARFLQRCFTPTEIAKAKTRKHGFVATLAKRYAAKEAAAKALGTGLSKGVFWCDIGVVNQPGGAPVLTLFGGAEARLNNLIPSGHTARLHLSITDEYPLATAQVLIEAVEVSKAS